MYVTRLREPGSGIDERYPVQRRRRARRLGRRLLVILLVLAGLAGGRLTGSGHGRRATSCAAVAGELSRRGSRHQTPDVTSAGSRS